jgi:hypothetical protein
VTGMPAQEIVVELQRPANPAVEKKIKHDGRTPTTTSPSWCAWRKQGAIRR